MNDIVKLMVDTYKGVVPTQYANTTREEREDVIRKALFEVLGASEYGSKEYRQAMRRNKAQVFEIIEELVDNTVIDGLDTRDAFINQFCEIKNLARGDKNVFYAEGTNQLAIAKYSGGHYNIKRQRTDVGASFSVDTYDYGVKVFEYWDRFIANRCDLSTLVAYAMDGIARGINDAVYATFNNALSTIPSTFKFNGNYNESSILTTISHVEAQNGVKPVLVGTRVALAKLQGRETQWMSESMKNEKNKTGKVESWNGYQCIELPALHKIGGTTFVFDDTTIMVLPANSKLVKVVMEGESEVVELTDKNDNADKSIETTIVFKMGTAVAYSGMIGTLVITN